MKENEPAVRLNLYDLLILMVRWRYLLIVNFILVVTVAVIVALTLPVWYSARTTILPPSGGSGGMPSFLPKDLVGVATSFGLDVPTDEIYQTVLSSRTLKERIIDRFNLREVYEMDEEVFPEDVVEAFESHMTVETRKDQAISITVEDRSPKLAADMANACVEELDRLYSDITSETARKNRTFIGRRLQRVNDSLAILQDSLMAFQQESNAISLPDQVMAIIKASSDIKAEQLATEVELEVLRNSFGSDHPLVNQLQTTCNQLQDKYYEMISGAEGGLLIDMQDLPEISRRYADIVRQVRIQNALIEYIYPQYENARIQEERETANVQILDKAREPNKKSRPSRRLIVMIAAVASILATLVLVLVFEYWRLLPDKNIEDWEKVQRIKRALWGKRK